MVQYITGNLFSTKATLIAHGVNCRGAFGSGVAGQMKRIFPGAYTAYIEKYQKEGWKLGDVQIIEIAPNTFPLIANCATQFGYGYADGQTVFADYPAIERVMEVLEYYCSTRKYSLAIPRIGAGLAGGDWETINQIIKDVFDKSPVTLEVYTL